MLEPPMLPKLPEKILAFGSTLTTPPTLAPPGLFIFPLVGGGIILGCCIVGGPP